MWLFKWRIRSKTCAHMIQYFVAAFDASFCLCNKNIGEFKKKNTKHGT